jgi:hypothetical protein
MVVQNFHEKPPTGYLSLEFWAGHHPGKKSLRLAAKNTQNRLENSPRTIATAALRFDAIAAKDLFVPGATSHANNVLLSVGIYDDYGQAPFRLRLRFRPGVSLGLLDLDEELIVKSVRNQDLFESCLFHNLSSLMSYGMLNMSETC